MIEREEDKREVVPIGTPPGRSEDLPYSIELWDATNHAAIERVLARAVNATLARAIFTAAKSEYPDRRIILCQGSRIIDDSAA